MNLILKYDDYLKRVYPTQALVTFDDNQKSKLILTKDKQIKQQFTGGKKSNLKDTSSDINDTKNNDTKNNDTKVNDTPKYISNTKNNDIPKYISNTKNNNNDKHTNIKLTNNKLINDEFEIKYIENDNNAFILNGGGDPNVSHKDFMKNLTTLSKPKTSNKQELPKISAESKISQPSNVQHGKIGLNRSKLEDIKHIRPIKEQTIIYVACASDDRSKNSLMSSLKSKYKKEISDDRLTVLPSLKMIKEGPEIIIVIDRNYKFSNNKIKLEDPKTDNLFYIPNDNSNFDFAKPTFMSNNSYVYDHLKPINYFDRKNNKGIKMQNEEFLNTYLDSKVTQLQNLYDHKNYIKLSKMNKELYAKIDNILSNLSPKKITGGYEDYYPEDPYSDGLYYGGYY